MKRILRWSRSRQRSPRRRRRAQKINLNVVTAGDQNMVDYVKDFLAPQFEKNQPERER